MLATPSFGNFVEERIQDCYFLDAYHIHLPDCITSLYSAGSGAQVLRNVSLLCSLLVSPPCLCICISSISVWHWYTESQEFGIGITSRFLFNLTATQTSDLMIQRNVFQHILISLRCDGTRHNTAPKEQTGPFTEVLRYINQGSRAFVVVFIFIGLIFLRFFNYIMYISHF